MNLAAYRKKRDFRKTPEPEEEGRARGKKSIFVVHEHAASHLHWDLRLEANGVLKSWAVPKGPPQRGGQKRLAIMVEDHPLSYAKFHGTIPEGQYGAGVVKIWDRGTYESEIPLFKGLARGNMKFMLHGRKLKGAFSLVKFKIPKQWLFIKNYAR